MTGESTQEPEVAPPHQAFEAWRQAVAALRSAEAKKMAHVELVRLSEEVIRTRNALTLDRIAAGLTVPAEIARQLETDEVLLYQHDDTHAEGLR